MKTIHSSSRTTLRKSLVIGTFFASSLCVFGQENHGTNRISNSVLFKPLLIRLLLELK